MPNFQKTAYTFPLAGLIIALPCVLVLWASYEALNLPPLACALCALAVLLLCTGALHEDGLADLTDGFWGGHSKIKKLEIMRDSAIGTYGVLALIICLGLRVVFIATFLETHGGFIAALIVLACASLSRMAMLQPWVFLPNARPSKQDDKSANEPSKTKSIKTEAGLSARYGMPDQQSLLYGVVATLPALSLLIFIFSLWPTLLSLIVFQGVIWAMIKLCRKHIGGHTGDTLGATQQMSELGLYFTLTIFI